MTKEVSKPGVVFCLATACGTRSGSVPFPLFSLVLPRDRGRGLARGIASWHGSHCFSLSAAEVLNFTSAFVFFFRT